MKQRIELPIPGGAWHPLTDVPPLNEDVMVAYIYQGERCRHIDRLIPTISGLYIWDYTDYKDCEVLGWRMLSAEESREHERWLWDV